MSDWRTTCAAFGPVLIVNADLMPWLSLAALAVGSIRNWYVHVASTLLVFLAHGQAASAQGSFEPLVIAALLATGVGWIGKGIVEVLAVLLMRLG